MPLVPAILVTLSALLVAWCFYKGIKGLTEGSVSHAFGFVRSVRYTRHADGWVYWYHCLKYLVGGSAIVAAILWVFLRG